MRETISYQIPTFKLNGTHWCTSLLSRITSALTHQYRAMQGEKAISPYAGEKGNRTFPLDQPIPYGLIERIVKLRVKQDLAKAAAKPKRGKS